MGISSFIESSPEGYESLLVSMVFASVEDSDNGLELLERFIEALILVLDEATSALDTSTEKALMDAVNQLSRDLTIVMIAHRISTIRRCDRVIQLSEGSVITNGSPQQSYLLNLRYRFLYL